MVARLEEDGTIRDPRVAAAMLCVPRERFVPPESADLAFRDEPLGIGEGQTISAPHMVAIMLEALDLAPGHRVLEVGGGSGYAAACAAELVSPGGSVVAVERIAPLADAARRALADTGYASRVRVVVGDGSEGHAAAAPYDRISVACAAPSVPPPLVEQLAPHGILLVPVGDRGAQVLLRVRKRADGSTEREDLGACRFVPLLGRHGFDEG